MNRKEKQLTAIELVLTMIVSMNKMEGQTTRFSYNGSQEHNKHQNVIRQLAERLGQDPVMVEDEVRRLVCRLMGEPTLLIPNQSVSIGRDDDLWRRVNPEQNGRIKLPHMKGKGFN